MSKRVFEIKLEVIGIDVLMLILRCNGEILEVLEEEERFNVLCELARQQGVDLVAEPDKIDGFYEDAYNNDLIDQFDNADAEEMAAFNEELEAAKKKAQAEDIVAKMMETLNSSILNWYII